MFGQGAREAESDWPALGYGEGSPLTVELAHGHVPHTQTPALPGLSPSGEPAGSFLGPGQGPVQVSQGLLLARAGTLGQPSMFRSGLGKVEERF